MDDSGVNVSVMLTYTLTYAHINQYCYYNLDAVFPVLHVLNEVYKQL